MRFTRAVVYHFEPIGIPIPFCDSTGGPFGSVPLECWLQLSDQDGIVGQCPCSYEMERVILPLIMNGQTRTYEEWYQRVYWAIRNRGFSGESVVEMGRLDLALHDIMAKRRAQPLHRFLGATRDWVNVYASGLGTGLEWGQMVAETERFVDAGYTTLKMKVGTDFGSDLSNDLKRIAEVRRIIGDRMELAIDANQLWRAPEALDFIRRAAQYNIAWYEEPVHSHDIEELESLCKDSPVDIAMGESLRNDYLFYVYARAGVKHLEPIPSNLGGVRDWMKVRELSKRFGTKLSSGGFSHITASFVATADEDVQVEYLEPIMRYFWEYMELRPDEREGKFFLPMEPGISCSPDIKMLDRLNKIKTVHFHYPEAGGGKEFAMRYGVKERSDS